ncbi:MAG: ATP-binding protein [Bacteroidota bacterium]|nr:ATP-binding protein [Bacteroidota bacterium]
MIKRKLESSIVDCFGKGKIISLLGPRQVGKTTLIRQIAERSGMKYLWLNGDESDVREILSNTTSTALKALTGNHKLIVIDEAQRIKNIGLTLKLFADNLNDIQVIATGSSSFELSNEINEPLTGRKYEFYLYPLSFNELVSHTNLLEEKRLLQHRMIFGYYPEVVTKPDEDKRLLSLLSESYLYKDIFVLDKIKKPVILEKLLQALALQLGNEVSFHELSLLLGINHETVERYIDFLEKSFVIYKLTSLSRNLRNELKRSRKIYFWDNGIRNSIIKNFNILSIRQDTGALWENFLMSERIKAMHYAGILSNQWFWRTQSQQEIDLIEEYNGQMYAYEFKWNPKAKIHNYKSFNDAYPECITKKISIDNFADFLLIE